MNIVEATVGYEKWLGSKLTLVEGDLQFKHERMAADPFDFFRATYYRWAQLWTDPGAAPVVTSVGDLHLENYGTWRDAEGRLIWGVNDFDETALLPYTNDLIRWATSLAFAKREDSFAIGLQSGCEAYLDGYRKGLEAKGQPWVLAEREEALWKMANGVLRNPTNFWKRSETWTPVDEVNASAREALRKMEPAGLTDVRMRSRRVGLGSLGRQRYVLSGLLEGSLIAREAKAIAPSAATWANRSVEAIPPQRVLETARRVQDPFVSAKGGWMVRRLAPDCSRIMLAFLPKKRDEEALSEAMGFETANVHLAGVDARPEVLADLARRPRKWLRKQAEEMEDRLMTDYEGWRKHLSR